MKIKCFTLLFLVTHWYCVAQDLISEGSNRWIFHTPDDGRTTMWIAPYTNNAWQWGKATQFLDNGNVVFSGSIGIGTSSSNARLQVDGDISSIGLNQRIGFSTYDNFINASSTIAHYGMSISRNAAAEPIVSHSGYFGINFFTVGTERMRINQDGNVGIGTPTPVSKLDVRGVISTPEIAFRNADGGDDSDPYRLRKVQGSSNVNWLELQLNDDFNESFRIYGNSCVGFGCGEYSGNLYHSFDAGGNVFHSGNVGIGTPTPGYKLDVIGTIRSREVKVDMNGADFVFEEKYPLMPLTELEAYIKKNKHLPEIAPAKEMQEQGSNLGDLNTKLLQKIEELTLYVIELKKQNDDQNKKIEEILKIKER